MDGVIYHGNKILPGVPEFIDWLQRTGKEYLFLTNNSGCTPLELKQKLARMGLDVPEARFYTSALATAAFGMLLWNPNWLGDISFQLSFIAVAAILAWGVPLCRLLHTRRRALNLLTNALVISLVAGIAGEVQLYVFVSQIDCFGRAVNGMYQLCTSAHGVEGETAGVAEHIQYRTVF